jgi:hypothetical protein
MKIINAFKKINKAIISSLNEIISKRKNTARYKLKSSINGWIRSSPEIESLLADGFPNSLSAQFGLRQGSAEQAVEDIVNAIVSSIQIEFKKIDKNFTGGVEFTCQPTTFSEILGLSSGHVLTEKGADLHWIDWLLTQGDKVIVVGYRYQAGSAGRSGGGRMIPKGVFRVPPKFSGSINDNFITRALSGKEQEISNILTGVFK